MMLSTAHGVRPTLRRLPATITDPQGSSDCRSESRRHQSGNEARIRRADQCQSGVYTIPFLPIGSYVISDRGDRIQETRSRPTSELEVNQIARINLALQVGAVSEQVTVSGCRADSADGERDGRSGHQLVRRRPIFRSMVEISRRLTLLIPGVVSPNPGAFNNASLQNGQGRPYRQR
jgi:hypothetical protein